jgi:hypothetical protein
MCLDDVARWMQSDIGYSSTRIRPSCFGAPLPDVKPSYHSAPLRAGTCSVYHASSVRDLGIFIDANLTMPDACQKTVSAFFAAGLLRQLTGLSRCVPVDTCWSFIISLVISRLDYENATPYDMPNYLYNTMRSVLNAAARSFFSSASV